MSSKIILYGADISPPVRTVKIVAKLLGVDYEYRPLDLLKGENMTEEYLRINPEHTVPTLVDDGNAIWDSQAICTYLIDKYGADDKLYPKNLILRAKCNQRLFFNASSLFVRLRDCSVAVFFKGATEVSQEKIDPINVAFDLLETFLVNDPYLVGNTWTIADISLANAVLTLNAYVPVTTNKHPKIAAWLDRVNVNIPHFQEINSNWPDQYKQFVTLHLEKNKTKIFT